MPYIQCVHNDKVSWHILVDSIMMDTSHGLLKLLIAMIDLSK
jgi:hypothetical protein